MIKKLLEVDDGSKLLRLPRLEEMYTEVLPTMESVLAATRSWSEIVSITQIQYLVKAPQELIMPPAAPVTVVLFDLHHPTPF